MRSSTVNSRILPLVWQLLLVSLAFVPTGWAAVANCTLGWEWSYNSMGQNPCEVAGYLKGACMGYGFEVFGPLPSGFWYPGPDKGDNADLLCDCDTVIYSVLAACTACQNVSTVTWALWSNNCSSVDIAHYPFNIPGATAVPRWAFIDVTGSNIFNATEAQDVGRDPEATSPASPSLSSSSSTLPSSSSTLPSSSNLASASVASSPSSTSGGNNFGGETSKHNNTPSIIGGVVGGVVGFFALSLLIWFFFRHRFRGVPFHAAHQPPTHRALSPRSYHPSSASMSSAIGPGMDENIRQTQGAHSHPTVTSPEFMYGSYPIISASPNAKTTLLPAPYTSGR